MNIPIFPLNTVLFPEGQLQLRIFEPRYLDMISNCMKQGTGFGLCLIQEGKDTHSESNPKVSRIGTFATITDFEMLKDGLLGITVTGGKRIRLLNNQVDHAGLMHADVECLDHDDEQPVPVEFYTLIDILRQIIERFKLQLAYSEEHFDNAFWVACRLSEFLPLDLFDRQVILEMDRPVDQLLRLQRLIATMQIQNDTEAYSDHSEE